MCRYLVCFLQSCGTSFLRSLAGWGYGLVASAHDSGAGSKASLTNSLIYYHKSAHPFKLCHMKYSKPCRTCRSKLATRLPKYLRSATWIQWHEINVQNSPAGMDWNYAANKCCQMYQVHRLGEKILYEQTLSPLICSILVRLYGTSNSGRVWL